MSDRSLLRWGAACVALIIAVGVMMCAPPALAAERYLLYRTHVDAAHLAWEGDGLAIKVIDGQTPKDPSLMFVRLGPDALPDGTEVSRIKLPANPDFSFLGKPGDVLWHAPQELYPGHAPVWAGFGVGALPHDVEPTILTESVLIEMVNVSGPGDVHVFSGGTKPLQVFSSVGTSHRTFHMTPGGHGHFSWTFSKPGRYDISWRGQATKRDGTVIKSPPTVVSWLVGTDEQVGLKPGTTRGNPITKPVDSPAPVPSSTPTAKPSATPSAPITAPPSSTPTAPGVHAYNPTKGARCVFEDGQRVALASSWSGAKKEDGAPADPLIKVTGTGGQELPQRKSIVTIPSSALTTVGTSGALNQHLAAGSKAYRLPEGISFDDSSIPFDKIFELRHAITEAYGPTDPPVMALTHGSDAATVVDLQTRDYSRQVVRPSGAGTMTHDVWFAEAGFYEVAFSTFVRLDGLTTEGEIPQAYHDSVLWFAVGDAAIAQACQGGPGPGAVTPSPSPTTTTSPTTTPTPTPSASPTPTATPTKDPAPAPALWLDKGHVDAFFVTAKDGRLSLNLREDITGPHVVRVPDSVGLHVLPEALVDLPAGVPGSPRGYLLPMTQDPRLLWPGWETTDVRDGGFDKIELNISEVAGPGDVHVFSMGVFGGITSLLSNGGTQLPGVIVAPMPAHTHANWVFSKPGRYSMTVQAIGTKAAERFASESRTYVWHVGEISTPTPAPTVTPSAEAPPSSNPTAPIPDVPPAPDAGTLSAPTVADVCRPTLESSQKAQSVVAEGHLDLGAQVIDGKLLPSIKDDRSAPPSWSSPNSVLVALGDQAKIAAPAALGFLAPAGNPIWLIGSTQRAGVPWLGQNTMHPSVVAGTTGPVTWRLVRVKGPGKVAIFQSGALGGGVGQRLADTVGGPTVHTVPANTHSHPNWAFTEAGSYTLTIEMSARLKSGQTVSGTSDLSFAVGVAPQAQQVAQSSVVGRTADGKPCQMPGGSSTSVTAGGGAAGAIDDAKAPEDPSVELPIISADPTALPAPVAQAAAAESPRGWAERVPAWLLVVMGLGAGLLGGIGGGLGVAKLRTS